MELNMNCLSDDYKLSDPCRLATKVTEGYPVISVSQDQRATPDFRVYLDDSGTKVSLSPLLISLLNPNDFASAKFS